MLWIARAPASLLAKLFINIQWGEYEYIETFVITNAPPAFAELNEN